jgi:holo-[acyl-carrier protein] synthase
MIIGLGIDVIEIERIRNLVNKYGDTFLNRCFDKREIEYCNSKANRYQHYAGKFTVKEAVFKALKMHWTEGFKWKDITIINNNYGVPEACLSGLLKERADELEITTVHISVSHCHQYAVAVALLTGG